MFLSSDCRDTTRVVENEVTDGLFRFVPWQFELPDGNFSGPLDELQQQPAHLGGLLLLHPMAGALDQMTTDHPGAGLGLHRLEHARALISAPILLARDEAGGHVDAAARPGLQFRNKFARGAAAIPL